MPAPRITHVALEPLETLPFLTVPPGGDAPQQYARPFCAGTISGLPPQLDAVVEASDLQGGVRRGAETVLLGEAAADLVALILAVHLPLVRWPCSAATCTPT